jgi:chaperonin GroES
MSRREPINENAGLVGEGTGIETPRSKKEIAFFMRPTPGRIIVQEDEFNYRGLIAIPDAAKRRPTTGKILAVGEGVSNPDLQVGIKVVYGLYSGTVINFKEQPAFRILGQDEVLAVIDDQNKVLEGVGT